MKGLLIKDFKLLKQLKKSFLVVFAVALLAGITMDNPTFLVGYLTFIVPFFAMSTIGYDEFENGNAFLFTLPISRKLYVLEKYCLSLLLTVASLVISLLAVFALSLAGRIPSVLEVLSAVPVVFLAAVVFFGVMLPLQLKFGAEKARIAMLLTGGVVALIGAGVVYLCRALQVNLLMLIEHMATNHTALAIACVVALVAAELLVSVRVSIAVMEKKSF